MESNHLAIPEKIICTPIVNTIRPVILINAPIILNLTRMLPIGLAKSMKIMLVNSAIATAAKDIANPLLTAIGRAAAIVAGPAIIGDANGTIDISERRFCVPRSKNTPFDNALYPTPNKMQPPATFKEYNSIRKNE